MVTDDERRRVARELRDFEFYYPENLDKVLREILRVDDETWVPGLLADLIEPSCDREALLALADKMENGPSGYTARLWFIRTARCIREACGEVANEQAKNSRSA